MAMYWGRTTSQDASPADRVGWEQAARSAAIWVSVTNSLTLAPVVALSGTDENADVTPAGITARRLGGNTGGSAMWGTSPSSVSARDKAALTECSSQVVEKNDCLATIKPSAAARSGHSSLNVSWAR
jgi:hypothetical protein